MSNLEVLYHLGKLDTFSLIRFMYKSYMKFLLFPDLKGAKCSLHNSMAHSDFRWKKNL